MLSCCDRGRLESQVPLAHSKVRGQTDSKRTMGTWKRRVLNSLAQEPKKQMRLEKWAGTWSCQEQQ